MHSDLVNIQEKNQRLERDMETLRSNRSEQNSKEMEALKSKLTDCEKQSKSFEIRIMRMRRAAKLAQDASKRDVDDLTDKLNVSQERSSKFESEREMLQKELMDVKQKMKTFQSKGNEAEKFRGELEKLRNELSIRDRELRDTRDIAKRSRDDLESMKRKWRDAEERCQKRGDDVANATRPLLVLAHFLRAFHITRRKNSTCSNHTDTHSKP